MIPLSSILGYEKCDRYLIFSGESALGDGFRAFLYFLGLAYCFIGLSAITARFFQSMENVVKHTRKVVEVDPVTKTETIRHEKVWNYTVADISLLAFGTSFPQISLATIDAIQNMGNLYAGGLLSKAFVLFLSYQGILKSSLIYFSIIILVNLKFGDYISISNNLLLLFFMFLILSFYFDRQSF